MKISEKMLESLRALQGYKTTANGYTTNPNVFKLPYNSVQALISRGLLREDGLTYEARYCPDQEAGPKRAALYGLSEAGKQV